MNSVALQTSPRLAVRFLLTGVVQGVGMRPTVARLAGKRQLNGFVRNDGQGVEIQVEGTAVEIESFAADLRTRLPASSRISQLRQFPAMLMHHRDFRIENSDSSEALTTSVPPDLSLCAACLEETCSPFNRRQNYPFVTCTDCGPRYSLLESMPFDRCTTSMNAFELCSDCASEYGNLRDRRFHAQTNACPACGPRLKFVRNGIADVHFEAHAITAAAQTIRSGGIVAVKGVGGYQLLCDATDTSAVEQLRLRKRRAGKPLVVMVMSVQEAEAFAEISATAMASLVSAQNPVVVVPLRSNGPGTDGRGFTRDASETTADCPEASLELRGRSHLPDNRTLAPAINPGLRDIGIMLPTSPLHVLLLKEIGRPCVVTSGNGDGEPLAFRMEESTEALQGIADGWLHHDRTIVRPIDDSVVRIIANRRATIRAARGLAPMSLKVSTTETILATGGHQKVAVALSNGKQSVLGPHVGDMDSVSTRQRFADHVQRFCELYQTKPTVIAHDLHPDYFTTRWAADQDVETIAVQHHHAHTAAGMMEHSWLDREVLGVCFDGTGYGTDGTIWGGEFLVCTAASFRRVARLRPFPLFGGEKAIREPWRIAAALLHEAGIRPPAAWMAESGARDDANCGASFAGPDRRRPRKDSLRQTLNLASISSQPLTSSIGRLFDGVAALLLNIGHVSFEGEAAMRLESTCDLSEDGKYDLPICGEDLAELDWRPMLREIKSDLQIGIPAGTIATKFTRGIATAVAMVCERIPQLPVVLSGGCFQNVVLTEMTTKALQSHPQPVGLPGHIPPNDGGLAAGQLAVASAQWQRRAQTEGQS